VRKDADQPARGWRKCSKDPTEVSKIIRRADETLPDFKERWTEEMGYIQGAPEMTLSNPRRLTRTPSFQEENICKKDQEHRTRDFGSHKVYRAEGYLSQKDIVEGITISHTFRQDNQTRGMITEGTKTKGSITKDRRTLRKENLDRYCDYHKEKGHYINDCYKLKRQLEADLESGKLNHLVKDVRQRGGN
nr:reverse transcriptase domain-containing protein [Tanacetum cinerariifolium]